MHVNGQLRFAGLEQLAADPTTELFDGRMYWNTTDKRVKVYNSGNSRWENSNKIEVLASNPVSNLYEGRTFWDTTLEVLKIRRNGVWREVSYPDTGAPSVENYQTLQVQPSGVPAWTWMNHFENLPTDPVADLYTGRVYWNTTTGEPRMYTGTVWQGFAPPDVAGNSGLYLFTDGVSMIWATTMAGTLPIQTGNAGKYLFTNGTIESWQFVQPQFNEAVVDNQVGELNITGLVYDKLTYNGVKLAYVIDRTDGSTPRSSIGELWLRYDLGNDTWNIHRANHFGDNDGVSFVINSSGQVRYTSDSMGGTYVGNMQITQIATMGNL